MISILTLLGDYQNQISPDLLIKQISENLLETKDICHIPYDSMDDLLEGVESINVSDNSLVLASSEFFHLDEFEKLLDFSRASYIPIVLVGENNNEQLIIGAMQKGVNELLELSMPSSVMAVKLFSQLRLSKMHALMREQNEAIKNNHAHIVHEQRMAKEVFSRVTHDVVDLQNIKHWLSPIAVFNGDILLASPTTSGGLLTLLGDFTGHGLGAAIGAIPLASTFYGMANKGFSMRDIVKELNAKLNALLPTGVFCCACVAQVNFEQGSVEILNAGLPDSYLVKTGTGELMPIPSSSLALGILGPTAFTIESQRFDLDVGDKLYLLSDGLLETENERGEQYGEDRLKQALKAGSQLPADDVFDSLREDVLSFIGKHARADDISLVEVNIVEAKAFKAMVPNDNKYAEQPPVSWRIDYEFDPPSLKNQDPVPLILHPMLEDPNLRQHSGEIFSIVSELYNNALDHGLLKLSSSIKQETAGFERYYQLREERLKALEDGVIKISLHYSAAGEGGCLQVDVIDSGEGFDYSILNNPDGKVRQLHGRGISVLKSVCRSIEYLGAGNHARVEYSW